MQINCHVPNGPLPVPKFGTLRLTLNKVLKVAMCISLTKSYHELVAFKNYTIFLDSKLNRRLLSNRTSKQSK